MTYKWPKGSKNAQGEDMTGKESSLYTTTRSFNTGTDTEYVMLFPQIFDGKRLPLKDAIKEARKRGVYKEFRKSKGQSAEKAAQIYDNNLPFRDKTKKKDK